MKQKKIIKTNLSLLKTENMDVPVEGISSMLSHKFGNIAQKTMEDKQRKNTKPKTARISIEDEVENCIHRMPNGKVGFPAAGFYNGMREVAPYLEGMNKKLVSGAVRIMGDDGTSLVKIDYKDMVTQKDTVTLPTGSADIRYRPRFEGWKCKLHIMFDASQISPEQIVNLLNYAGFHRGIGDWRPGSPKKPGQYGMYKIPETGRKKI